MTTTPTAAARVSGTIRQLEWEYSEITYTANRETDEKKPSAYFWMAKSPLLMILDYTIIRSVDERLKAPKDCYQTEICGERLQFQTLEGAQEAVQADYERRALNRILAAIQPDPEPVAVAWQRNHPQRGWIDVHQEDIEHYRSVGQVIRPLYAIPSSAGTVSVEAAARPMSDVPEEGTWALLYPGYYGPVTACVMNGEWSLYDEAEKPHVTHWVEAISALRGLAGEGGR